MMLVIDLAIKLLFKIFPKPFKEMNLFGKIGFVLCCAAGIGVIGYLLLVKLFFTLLFAAFGVMGSPESIKREIDNDDAKAWYKYCGIKMYDI